MNTTLTIRLDKKEREKLRARAKALGKSEEKLNQHSICTLDRRGLSTFRTPGGKGFNLVIDGAWEHRDGPGEAVPNISLTSHYLMQ